MLDKKHIETLFKQAIEDGEIESQDPQNETVAELQRSMGTKVFARASELCGSESLDDRIIGVWVLGQNNSEEKKLEKEATTRLLELLSGETEQLVITSIALALGHLGDSRAVAALTALRKHEDDDVREAVAYALAEIADPGTVPILIELSRDVYEGARSYAILGLGTALDLDTPEIREALADRLEDIDDETRGEALVGLARRKDPRVLAALRAELQNEDVGTLPIEAAMELADPSLLESLEELEEWWDEDPELLKAAIRACKKGSKGK
jgi:HEAT repeat protein